MSCLLRPVFSSAIGYAIRKGANVKRSTRLLIRELRAQRVCAVRIGYLAAWIESLADCYQRQAIRARLLSN